MKFNIFYIFFGLYILINISCTRTPPNTSGLSHLFKPGTTDNLHDIDVFRPLDLRTLADEFKQDNSKSEDDTTPPFLNDDLMDRVLQIRTSDDGQLAKVSSSRSGISIEPESNISFVNQYYFLNYRMISEKTKEQKLLSDLLGHIDDFKGFPNTTYYIVPQLQDNYLMLYRVGKKDSIPYDEMHLAVKIGDWFATPLVGYTVEYCEPEKIFNDDYEETNVYRPKCYSVPRQSSEYVQLNGETKTVFQYASKLDVFPSNFFDGKWYAVKTVVKSSERASEEIGHQTFENALLVEFRKTTTGLQAVDASGYQLKEEDQLASFFIPVEWKEYKMDRDTNILHQLAEQESERQVDVQRPYFKINFQTILSLVEKEESTGNNIQRTEIRNILITDDYFSYIVETRKLNGSVQWMKHAFRKAKENSGYQEKQWYEKDSSQFFPSFMTYRSHYVDSSVYTEADWGRFYRTTRFDPNSKVITWYFSKQSSRDHRKFGRMAVALWNEVFQLAGKGQIKIVLNETVERELGDIRYNIINLIQTQSESDSGVLGFGPNIYNPVTGEIVSATANIWVTSIVDSYVDIVRQYIRFHIYPPEWRLLKDSQGVSPFIYEKIKKLCSGNDGNKGVKEFIDAYKKENSSIIHPDESTIDDREVVPSCAWKLAESKLLQVTLHEMGHGFGLRHVFSASADATNFYKSYDEIRKLFDSSDISIIEDSSESYSQPAQYSSVMDYTAHQYPKLTVPGKYDVAAIRFIYFDQVELESREFLKIPHEKNSEKKQKSIIDYAKAEGQVENLKRYHVCGGKLPTLDNYHSSEMNADDPLCVKYDYGKTPYEVVSNFIYDSKNTIMMQTRRYDQARISSSDSLLYSLDPGNSLLPLLYKWYNLLDIFFNESNQTIFRVSSIVKDDVNNYNQKLQIKAADDPVFNRYYEIRQPIFDYFKKVFFFPFKHCVYINGENNNYEVWALEAIIQTIEGQYSENDRKAVLNCRSSVVKEWAAKQDGDLVLKDEIGFIGVKDSYFLDRREEDITDEISVFKPIESSGGKTQSIWSMILNKLASVLLEPSFRYEMREEWLSYIKTGVDPNLYRDGEEYAGDFPISRQLMNYEVDPQLETLYTRMKRYIDLQTAIFKHTTDFNLRQEITNDINCRPYTFTEFYQYAESILVDSAGKEFVSNPGRSQFIQDSLKFFKENKEHLPPDSTSDITKFIYLILNSPYVYRVDEKEMVCVPENEKTFFGQIFHQFNLNKGCLYNQDPATCESEDIKNKEAFNLAVIRLVSSEIEGL